MKATEWERVTSDGQLVYWCRHLSDRSYLTVSRLEDGWVWRHRGPEMDQVGAYKVHAEGTKVVSAFAAKRDADHHLASLGIEVLV